MELASLAIAVDSRSARKAADDLDNLTRAGERSEKAAHRQRDANGRFTKSTDEAAKATGRQRDANERVSQSSDRASRAIDDQARSTSSLTDLVRRYAQVAVGAFGVREVIQAADAWQGLENRLRLVTNGQEALARATGDVFAIAQRTSQGMDSVAQVYQRFAQNASTLGLNQRKLAELTETVGKAIAISGGSAESAEGALMQFGQALAAGVLRGEEFNSVMEGAPSLMQAIATGMGVPIGALREMAAEGKITGDIIVEALTKARNSVDEQFGTRVKTIGQAFTELANATTRYIGQASQSTGVMQAVANGISTLAENIDEAARFAMGFATVAIPAVIRGVASLTAAIAANPLGLIAVGAAAAVGYLAAFGDEISVVSGGLTTLADVASVVWGDIKDAAQTAIGAITDLFAALAGDSEETAKSIGGYLFDMAYTGLSAVETLIGGFMGGLNAIRAGWSNLPEMFRDIFTNAMNFAITKVEDGINAIVSGINSLYSYAGLEEIPMVALSRFGSGAEKSAGEWGSRITDAFKEGLQFDALTGWVDSVMERASNRAADRSILASAEGAISAYGESAAAAAAPVKKLTELTDAQKKALAELEKQRKQFEEERKRSLYAQYDEIAAIQEQARQVEDQIATYGQGQAAIDALVIARLEEKQAILALFDPQSDQLKLIEREIEARQRLTRATSTLDALDANKKAADEAVRQQERAAQESLSEWERMNDQIGQSLTDALMRGFEDGKGFAENFRDALQNIFQTMILRPIIEPIVKQASGTVQSLTGTGPQVGSGGIPDTSFLRSNSFQPGASMGTEFMANSWGQVGGDSMEALIAGNSSNWGVTSNMSSNIGAGMGYAAAIYALTEKQYATAIGTAVGTYIMPGIGTAIGSLLGNFVDGMLGDKLAGETRAGAQYGLVVDGELYNPRRGTSRATDATGVQWLEGPSGGGDSEGVRATIEATTKGINEMFRLVGADVSLSGFWAGFEGSEKGRGGVGAGGTLNTGAAFGELGTGSNYDKSLFDPTRPRSLTAEEAANMLPAQLAQASLEAWQAAAEQMPSALAQMLQGVDFAAMGDEALVGLRDQFVAIVVQADQMRAVLGTLPFVPATAATLDFATALMQAAGGAENAANLLGSYYQSYFSESERMGFLTEQLTDQFSQMGMTLPKTREEFRGLVEANMALGEAGAKTVASLLGLGEGLNTLITYTDQAAQAAAQATQKALEDAQRAAYEAAVAARQTAEQGASDAMSILANAVNARKTELQRAFDQVAEGLSTAIEASQSTLSNLGSLAGSLKSTLRTMAGQFDPVMNRASAQAQIAQALATAQMTGVMPNAEDLQDALQVVAQPSEGLFSSFEAYQLDFLRTANDIDRLNSLTGDQISIEEQTLKALQSQLEAETAQFEQEMARYDSMLDLAQQQLDAELGTGMAVMTVEQAITNLAEAMKTLRAAPAPAAGGGGGGSSGGGFINDLYRDILGRDVDQPGLDYWTGQLASGAISAGDLAQAIRDGVRNDDKVRRSYDVGTGYVPYDMSADIHQGEIIIDPRSSDILRRYGIGVQAQGGNTGALERRIDELVSDNRKLVQYNYQMLKELMRIKNNTEDSATAMRSNGNSNDAVLVF